MGKDGGKLSWGREGGKEEEENEEEKELLVKCSYSLLVLDKNSVYFGFSFA